MNWKLIKYCSIICAVIVSCAKEPVGPKTEKPPAIVVQSPSTPTIGPITIPAVQQYGSMVIYTTWVNYTNYCLIIPVYIDDSFKGNLNTVLGNIPDCGNTGTITVDSLKVGVPHKVYIGKCNEFFAEAIVYVEKDECVPVVFN